MATDWAEWERGDLATRYPQLARETDQQFADRLVRVGRPMGINANCSLGWHEDCWVNLCNNRNIPCTCECHPK